MDTENVSRAIQIRKAVRDRRKELRAYRDDELYAEFRKELREAMNRCEDEMGDYIPMDSDDDDDDYYSEDEDDFYYDEFDEDDLFAF